MVKPLYSILIVVLSGLSTQAQITDVFQNQDYQIATHVFEETINKEYHKGSVEILLDKNKGTDPNWKAVEDQLYATAIEQVKNDVAYFQLYSRAVNDQKRMLEWQRLHNAQLDNSPGNPSLKNIDISLSGVVNAIGVYVIYYHFQSINGNTPLAVKRYYLADFRKRQLTPLPTTLNRVQQQKLDKLTRSRFTAIYLLQTQKLDLNNAARIRETQKEGSSGNDHLSELDFSEAEVFPYFSGIMVEFPMHSASSVPFALQSFRILLTGSDVTELLRVFPAFKPAFGNPLNPPSQAAMAALNDDSNFDISRFRKPRDAREIIEAASGEARNPEGKLLHAITINYYQMRDTAKQLTESKKVFYNDVRQIYRTENRNERGDLTSQEKRTYNEHHQLIEVRATGSGEQLTLYYYSGGGIDRVEKIELQIHQSGYHNQKVNTRITHEHVVFNSKHRYTLQHQAVGELNKNHHLLKRYLAENKHCTHHACLINDDKGRVMGIENLSGSPIDLRTDEKGNPMESYFDGNRDQHFFSYDQLNRIQEYSYYRDDRLMTSKSYQYRDSGPIPEMILGAHSQHHSAYTTVEEYALEFK